MDPNVPPDYPIHPSYLVMQSRGSDLAWLIKTLLIRPFGRLRPWARRARERAQLAAMDANLRQDLGLSTAAIQREVNKPVWTV